MASIFTTGPANIFVGIGANKTMLYLGTCMRPPRIRIRRGNVPVFNDLGGTQIPFDMMSSNQEAFTKGTLNRFNRPVMNALQAMPNPYSGVRGLQQAGDIGSLYIQEGLAFPLVMQFPNYLIKPAMRAAGLPPGYLFYATWFEGPDDEDIGTTDNKIDSIFHSLSVFNPANGQMALYTTTLPTLPAIN